MGTTLRFVGTPEPEAPSAGVASVHVLPRAASEEEILTRLRARDPDAAAMLYDRFAPEVNRLVWRLLGADRDHDDLVQQVFCKLLTAARRVEAPEHLRPFVLRVAVNTVRSELRKRAVRRRFLRAEEDLDRFESTGADLEGRELLRRTFDVLERMPLSERLAFTLRHVDSRPLDEVAALSGCSLATIKRKLAKARRRFTAMARHDPLLAERLDNGPLEVDGGPP